jgi:hypothetical protein
MASLVRSRILRTLIVLAITACAVVAVSPVVGASPTLKATIQPRYTECSTTVWHNTNQTDGGETTPIVTIYVTLQILEDSHDFSYCGALRTYLTWTQTSNHCDTFYAAVRDPSNNNHGTNHVYSCAQGGSWYSLAYYASCGSAYGWDTATGAQAQTIGGCF